MRYRHISLLICAGLLLAVAGCTRGETVSAEPSINTDADAASVDTTPTIPEDGPGELWHGPRVNKLASIEDLDAALATSNDSPIFIYKHSTQCPINARSAFRLQEYMDKQGDALPKMQMVWVIESRPLSDAIEEKLGVKHESPQLLLVKDGKALWNASHEDITAENVRRAMDTHLPAPAAEPPAGS
ncbi:MAG: bacillithiol system redox-active protein YtxJ [Candidatus Hydrogenedentota bacterium]